jgi:hypothetical protein
MEKDSRENTVTQGLIIALENALTAAKESNSAYDPESLEYEELRDTSFVFDEPFKVLNHINDIIRQMKVRRKETLSKIPPPAKKNKTNEIMNMDKMSKEDLANLAKMVRLAQSNLESKNSSKKK